MSIISTSELFYPETDGKPMGESDIHIDWTIRVRQILKHRYRDQRVYVGSDLFIYYVKHSPKHVVAPDAFVVLNSDPGRRRVYKLWEEERAPNFVLEITSESTRDADVDAKFDRYELMQVPEYFLYDPTSDYLDPPLIGYRLTPYGYEMMEAVDGKLQSKELGLSFWLDDVDLVIEDSLTGEIQLTAAEAADQRAQAQEAKAHAQEAKAQAQEAKAEAERQARLVAERRIAELEAELRKRDR